MANDRKKTIAYWVTTALVTLAFGVGGAANIARPPEVLEVMTHLGYPGYAAAIIGVFKVLGAVVIVAPRLPRLKEWAYAGILIDLVGAIASHATVGDGAGDMLSPLVLLAIAAASWSLRPDSRKLAGPLF